MKIQYNLTTSSGDLDRYTSRAHFLSTLEGFDGVELMYAGEEDVRQIVPREKIIGFHMSFLTYWLDFWNGDLDHVREEFDSLEKAYAAYGGADRAALLRKIRGDYDRAVGYGAEYMVFHATHSAFLECMTGNYRHSDEEVVDALCDMLNQALPNDPGGPLLLLENLWEPGLTFTRPEITRRLLEGVRYPNVGLMLDTGHLMHTELALKSQPEALAYIHRCLDRHGDLCRYIRGVHLHQSITGPYIRKVRNHPPQWPETYEKRLEALFYYIFSMDLHKPFTCPGVGELIRRISPDYLTFEFISNDLPHLLTMLRRQATALQRDPQSRPR